MISKLASKMANLKKEEGGFTLIELMIVVAIIGILAAIAIPQFATYRQKAYDSAAKADLTNLATEEENYFLDNSTYTTTLTDMSNFRTSTSITVTVTSGNTVSFVATAKHAASQNTWTYNSGAGGLQ